jgi:hypothetical protein
MLFLKDYVQLTQTSAGPCMIPSVSTLHCVSSAVSLTRRSVGEEGLKTAWPSHLRNLPPEQARSSAARFCSRWLNGAPQLRDVLLGLQLEATRLRVENMVRPRGSLTLGFDASALATLGKDEVTSEWSLSRRVAAIPSMVRASRFGLRHSVQVSDSLCV